MTSENRDTGRSYTVVDVDRGEWGRRTTTKIYYISIGGRRRKFGKSFTPVGARAGDTNS